MIIPPHAKIPQHRLDITCYLTQLFVDLLDLIPPWAGPTPFTQHQQIEQPYTPKEDTRRQDLIECLAEDFAALQQYRNERQKRTNALSAQIKEMLLKKNQKGKWQTPQEKIVHDSYNNQQEGMITPPWNELLDDKAASIVWKYMYYWKRSHNAALMHCLGAILARSPVIVQDYWQQHKRRMEASTQVDVYDDVLSEGIYSKSETRNIRQVVRNLEEFSVDTTYESLWTLTSSMTCAFPLEIDLSEAPEGFKLPLLKLLEENELHADIEPPDPAFIMGCQCVGNCYSQENVNNCQCIRQMDHLAYDHARRLKLQQPLSVIFECNRQCSCCTDCHNKTAQRPLANEKMQLRFVGKKGLGVFASHRIARGTFIAEYLGELIAHETARNRDKVLDAMRLQYQFAIATEEGPNNIVNGELDRTIDAFYKSNIVRFFNHACDGGNLKPQSFTVEYQDKAFIRMGFFANKDIEVGEEMTFNYGENYELNVQCNCSSAVHTIKTENDDDIRAAHERVINTNLETLLADFQYDPGFVYPETEEVLISGFSEFDITNEDYLRQFDDNLDPTGTNPKKKKESVKAKNDQNNPKFAKNAPPRSRVTARKSAVKFMPPPIPPSSTGTIEPGPSYQRSEENRSRNDSRDAQSSGVIHNGQDPQKSQEAQGEASTTQPHMSHTGTPALLGHPIKFRRKSTVEFLEQTQDPQGLAASVGRMDIQPTSSQMPGGEATDRNYDILDYFLEESIYVKKAPVVPSASTDRQESRITPKKETTHNGSQLKNEISNVGQYNASSDNTSPNFTVPVEKNPQPDLISIASDDPIDLKDEPNDDPISIASDNGDQPSLTGTNQQNAFTVPSSPSPSAPASDYHSNSKKTSESDSDETDSDDETIEGLSYSRILPEGRKDQIRSFLSENKKRNDVMIQRGKHIITNFSLAALIGYEGTKRTVNEETMGAYFHMLSQRTSPALLLRPEDVARLYSGTLNLRRNPLDCERVSLPLKSPSHWYLVEVVFEKLTLIILDPWPGENPATYTRETKFIQDWASDLLWQRSGTKSPHKWKLDVWHQPHVSQLDETAPFVCYMAKAILLGLPVENIGNLEECRYKMAWELLADTLLEWI